MRLPSQDQPFLVKTGWEKSEQVWSTIFFNRESHALQIWPTPKPACSFLTVPWSKIYDPPKGLNSSSPRSSCHRVWTGVKWNFPSAHQHDRYVVEKLSISQVRMWDFTRIRRKTKKLRPSIIPAQRQWPVPTNKNVWTTTFLRRNCTSRMSLKSSWSRKLKYAVSPGLAKR